MIIEQLFLMSAWWNEFLAGFAPQVQADDPVATIDGWTVLISFVAGAGAWVNVPALMALCTIAISFYIASIVFKLFRQVLAHVPLIGGRG